MASQNARRHWWELPETEVGIRFPGETTYQVGVGVESTRERESWTERGPVVAVAAWSRGRGRLGRGRVVQGSRATPKIKVIVQNEAPPPIRHFIHYNPPFFVGR